MSVKFFTSVNQTVVSFLIKPMTYCGLLLFLTTIEKSINAKRILKKPEFEIVFLLNSQIREREIGDKIKS